MDPDVLPISAIEHWSYCPRQCALIHVEGTYEENVFTRRGHRVHARAHEGPDTEEEGVRVVRGMTVWSDRLGLIGRADVVEFRPEGPFPIEYKVGRPGPWDHAEVQLAAQALCLEEMLSVTVPRGAIYYHAVRRRREVEIGAHLREKVLVAIEQVGRLLGAQETPGAVDDARCPHCSLVDACLPAQVAHPRRVQLLYSALFSQEDE